MGGINYTDLNENNIYHNRNEFDIEIASNNSLNSFDSQNNCRICFEPVTNIKRFCLCNGTMANIHDKCLIKWLNINQSTKCEICKYEYKLKIKKKILWCKFLYLLCVMSFFIIGFYYIVNPFKKDIFSAILSSLFVLTVIILVFISQKSYYIEIIARLLEIEKDCNLDDKYKVEDNKNKLQIQSNNETTMLL